MKLITSDVFGGRKLLPPSEFENDCIDIVLTVRFVFCVEHGMSYLKRWRKIRSEAAEIALECCSEDDCPEILDHPNQCDVDGGENLAAEENSTLHESAELGDTDSDFGYKEYVSTDSKEGTEFANGRFQEDLSRKACFLGYKK